MADKKGLKAVDSVYDLFANFEELYPGIQKWFWESVINGDPHTRVFVSLVDQNVVIGWLALKQSGKDIKLCSAYIDEEHRGQGILRLRLSRALPYFAPARNIYATVAESVWEESARKALTPLGFEYQEPSKKQYRTGDREIVVVAPWEVVMKRLRATHEVS